MTTFHFDHVIDLDVLTGKQDADVLVTFGDVEFVIQYRVENALRDPADGSPFLDLLTERERPFTVDLLVEDGDCVAYEDRRPVVQLLLGQRVAGCPREPEAA